MRKRSGLKRIMDYFFAVKQVELEAQEGLDPLVIVTTNCSVDEADALASTMVKEHLAACVNVVPGVKSFYVWEEQFTEDAESTLVIKTTDARLDDLVRRLRELHSYSTPEIVMVKPDSVDAGYLSWVREMTRKRP